MILTDELSSKSDSNSVKGRFNASVNSNCALPPHPRPLSRATAGHLPSCQSRGGALANLVRPGGRAFANPRENPEKFVDVFKGMFS